MGSWIENAPDDMLKILKLLYPKMTEMLASYVNIKELNKRSE